MSALIEAARAAMQALYGYPYDDAHWTLWCKPAADNLREALAAAEAQPVGEPFGYVITNNVPESSPYRHVFYRPSEISTAYKDNALYSTPLYTAPPAQPAAQPLTDRQLAQIWDEALDQLDTRDQLRFIARAIEHAHGIGELK